MKTTPTWLLSCLALTGIAQTALAGADAPVLKVQIHLSGKQSIAQVNRELARRGVKGTIPSTVVLDLSRPREELNDKYWKLSELTQKAEADLDVGESLADACFTGSNVEVADNIDKLSDGWLSDQFQIISTATKKPDHVGILYAEGDDGTDKNWLNFERCKR